MYREVGECCILMGGNELLTGIGQVANKQNSGPPRRGRDIRTNGNGRSGNGTRLERSIGDYGANEGTTALTEG